MVQPPPGCAAERADAVALLIEDEHRDDGFLTGYGREKRRIVREAEIVAKPND
jgi:hypothetical protein